MNLSSGLCAPADVCTCPMPGVVSSATLDPDKFNAAGFCISHFDLDAARRSAEGIPRRKFLNGDMPVELAVALALTLINPKKKGTLRAAQTAGRRLIRFHGGTSIRDLTAHQLLPDFAVIRQEVRDRSKQSRSCRDGDGAVEAYVAFIRRLFKTLTPYLGADVGNAGLSLEKPRRKRKGEREHYTCEQLPEIWHAAGQGSDPRLFRAMLDALRETAMRRMSLLGLNLEDIEWSTGKTTLRGKGGRVYQVYLSHQTMQDILCLHLERRGLTMRDIPELMTHLAREGYDPEDGADGTPAFVRRNGTRITRNTTDALVRTVREHADPTLFKSPFILHSIRHTTLGQIKENFDEAMASAFAGHHTNRDLPSEATRDYVTAREPLKIAVFNELFGPQRVTGPRPPRSTRPGFALAA